MPSEINIGGGQYLPSSSISIQTVTAQPGEFINLTAPAGKRIRLELLATTSSSKLNGVTIVKDGETFLTGGILAAAPFGDDEFAISQTGSNQYASTNPVVNFLQNMITDFVFSQLSVTLTAGSAPATIKFSYTVGD